MSSNPIAYYESSANRIEHAASAVFGDRAVAHEIRTLCADYLTQCRDVLDSRGVSWLTIAIVGVKGQGKTWVAKQFLKRPELRSQLASGVLSSEATTKLCWIGPSRPESFSEESERTILCDSTEMEDLGQPYMLLDTPGVTDANRRAAQIAREALSLAPIKLLVIRRDQMRAAWHSQLSYWIEGAICIPVITCVDPSELDEERSSVGHLERDRQKLIEQLRAAAPQTRLLESILIPDFDATGDEATAGTNFLAALRLRLQDEALGSLAMTKSNRLSSLTQRLHHDVRVLVETKAPELAGAVRMLLSEADRLPVEVVDSLLGTQVILDTAVRSRLRAQMIADTSTLWFPYRTTLSVLGLTQGAWDRVVMALSGSIPSLFGALASWAKNFRQASEAGEEMQNGIRERLSRRVSDRLEPISRKFHVVLSRLRTGDTELIPARQPSAARLGGIDELQSQSVAIFERALAESATHRGVLQVLGLIAVGLFWGFLSGPIVSIYRQYIAASYDAVVLSQADIEKFPKSMGGLLWTSILLSAIPMILFSMICMAYLLRRSRIQRVSLRILGEHRTLIERLKSEGVLHLKFSDPALEEAEFLLRLDRRSSDEIERGF